MVGLSEEYGGPGMEYFDVYRNLGLSPYEIRINNVDHLKWVAKKAGFLIHHDRLMRHHANKPPDVDLGTLNGLVSYISELETQEQHLAIEELNNRARADWRSTWSVKDKIGDWRPHKPHIGASDMVPSINGKLRLGFATNLLGIGLIRHQIRLKIVIPANSRSAHRSATSRKTRIRTRSLPILHIPEVRKTPYLSAVISRTVMQIPALCHRNPPALDTSSIGFRIT